ncbi:hypothetical protein VE01_05859 [Pseudogymnoascus verrucosus]|uniref:AB hydrolase-1 domain-containing protein n=1 Tax=Pseudogymnoascus verrucosus TaxID=342668 RepID=A0A1B8GKA4_9PEZI|nr:uncharacterized protein VE01_05859 [Pseudogymnoascus verrucosus]OBT96265.1 hypothetical protein VE01_05859 [Pseudogymnoascus verrucosus]
MLVVLHGVSGGSHESFIREMIATLIAQNGKGERNWEACVVNSRGCARSKISSQLMYNGRATWDLRQTANWLGEKFPNRPLFAAGISLGANLLTNYLAEEGSNSPFKAAIVFSNPWTLELSSMAMRRGCMGREVYSRAVVTGYKKYVKEHLAEISKYTDIDVERVKNAADIREFDKLFLAPASGYPTPGAYYRDGSCCDALLAVKTPLLALNALDDPIVPPECIPFDAFEVNPFAVLCTTTMGGHIGWHETSGTQWVTKQMSAFLNAMADNANRCWSPATEETSV